MISKLSTIFLFTLSFPVLATSNIININPLEKVAPEHYTNATEKVTLSLAGRLEIVPMRGAMLTLQSTNYGQILLFRPFVLSDEIRQRLEQIEKNQTTVIATGTMLTTCSAAEMQQPDVVGCRELDLTQPISIKPL